MCGITGVMGDSDVSHGSSLLAMLHVLEHRGRPGTLYEIAGFGALACALGTNRLPIVSPSENRQPARSPSGRYAVVMNGEIFNYRSLASQLPIPSTAGDVAVLAAALEEWGVSRTLASLAWEGAFVAVDQSERRLLAARDHLGIKPLYFCRHGGKTWFASEIKALRGHGGDAIVSPIEPGCVAEFRLDSPTIRHERWWAAPMRGDGERPAVDVADRVHELLRAAVRDRVPEEPYAVLLSGGVDSSLILRMAIEQNARATAYVLCTPESPDLPYARALCAELGTPLVEVPAASSEELACELPGVVERVESWEWQVVNHAAPMDKLFATVRADGHKVVLTGEGADELFFGYEDPARASDNERHEAEQLVRVADLHRTNCRRLDRMGMSHSLECRVPFLERALTELALSLPSKASLSAGVNKRPLRDVAERILPPRFARRKKLSFARGAGYRYGGSDSAASVFGPTSGGDDAVPLPQAWEELPRYPSERLFLGRFLQSGYGRADYLRRRSL